MHGLFGRTDLNMDYFVNQSVKNMSKEKVDLTVDDIPGAKIPRDTVDECSVVQLKRWLLCRGAKTSGKKAVLITRVKSYIEHGLDTKYLRDPDGGVHLLKKKAQLGVLDNAEPKSSHSFPKEGFSCDLDGMPRVTFGTIWRYMIDCVEIKKQLSTAKPLVKGYNFYKSGHVLFISHLAQQGKHYVKSQVMPSMKKNPVYTCFFVMTSLGNVLRAQCGCPAGVDGRCNHVTATMFALEEYSKQKAKLQTDSTDLDSSCTSKPCKWNVPRKRKGNVMPIVNMSFEKHDYLKNKKMRKSFAPPGHDVRALHQRTWSDEKLKSILSLVKDYQEKAGKVVGWAHILPQEVDQALPTKCDNQFDSDPCNDLLSPIKEHPVAASTIKDRCEEIEKKLKLSDDQIIEIERLTRGQSNNTVWYNERKHRITASKCHRVGAMKDSTSPTKAVQEVLQYTASSNFQSKSMKAGIEMEGRILEDYKILMYQKGHNDLSVSKCGFFVSKNYGFLGASPDALANDPSSSDPKGLVEIKYIQMNENECLCDSLLRKRICSRRNYEIELNANHQYYSQVQHQMYVTERNWTDFVVKGSGSNEIFCQRINFSEEFWNRIFPKLYLFFQRWIAPEIAYPRIKYGLPKLDFRSL